MDLFNENVLAKLYRIFSEDSQTLRIVSMGDPSTSLEYLLGIKQLFQRMLPKMPREYILRQVFDYKHCSLVLGDSDGNVIGAVCYRPGFERSLVEIVFFEINSEYHINGYGTFLFNCLKEVCKQQYAKYLEVGDAYKENNIEIRDLKYFDECDDTDDQRINAYTDLRNLYLLTNADNSAIGFFKKQGFTLSPVSSGWIGYIKDYDGGTLMECKLHRRINSLKKRGMIQNLRKFIFEKMKNVNEYHIVRKWDDREDLERKFEEERMAKDSPEGSVHVMPLPAKPHDLEKYFFKNEPLLSSGKEPAVMEGTTKGKTFHLKVPSDVKTPSKHDLLSAAGVFSGKGSKTAPPYSSTIADRPVEDLVIPGSCDFAAENIFSEPNQPSSAASDNGRGNSEGRTATEFLFDFIFFLICNLQSNSSAWPFLEHVSIRDVPDYFDIITHPMDLSTISLKHRGREYTTLRKFIDDMHLIVNNCRTYNGPETQYYRCGENMQAALECLLERYADVIKLWGYGYQ